MVWEEAPVINMYQHPLSADCSPPWFFGKPTSTIGLTIKESSLVPLATGEGEGKDERDSEGGTLD